MSKQREGFSYSYIDAFAGPGKHISKRTGKFVAGSPRNALLIDPPFSEYHFIDLDRRRIAWLRQLKSEYPGRSIHIYHEDCNDVLLDLLPRVEFAAYRRALCLLDPYGLHLDWRVVKMAGRLGTVEVFLNFPVLDMNRNALWRDWSRVPPAQIARMSRYWGDESWRDVAYEKTLFEGLEAKAPNDKVAQAFRERLKSEAGFRYVPRPVPMRNSSGAIIYYLMFAAHKPVSEHIVSHIFDKYRNYR